MGPTTLTSIGLVLFALVVLGLTAYGYYLLLFAGASLRPAEDDDAERAIESAVEDLRNEINPIRVLHDAVSLAGIGLHPDGRGCRIGAHRADLDRLAEDHGRATADLEDARPDRGAEHGGDLRPLGAERDHRERDRGVRASEPPQLRAGGRETFECARRSTLG